MKDNLRNYKMVRSNWLKQTSLLELMKKSHKSEMDHVKEEIIKQLINEKEEEI